MATRVLILGFAMAGVISPQDEETKRARAAISEFRKAFSDRKATDEERACAVQQLATIQHVEVARTLAWLLTTAPDGPAIEAAKGLSGFGDVKGAGALGLAALQDSANAKRTAVRVEIVRALGALKHRETLQALHALMRKDEADVAKEAVVAIQCFRCKESVADLIAYLRLCESIVSGEAQRVDLPVMRSV